MVSLSFIPYHTECIDVTHFPEVPCGRSVSCRDSQLARNSISSRISTARSGQGSTVCSRMGKDGMDGSSHLLTTARR